VQGEAGVDDVFHDDHVAVLKAVVHVFDEPHLAGAAGAGVTGHGDEVHRDRAGHGAQQVGQEEDRALEHADEVQVGVGRVVPDLLGQIGDALADGFGGQERRDDVRHETPRVAQQRETPREDRR